MCGIGTAAMARRLAASPVTWLVATRESPTLTNATGRPWGSNTPRTGLRFALAVPIPRLTVTGCPRIRRQVGFDVVTRPTEDLDAVGQHPRPDHPKPRRHSDALHHLAEVE